MSQRIGCAGHAYCLNGEVKYEVGASGYWHFGRHLCGPVATQGAWGAAVGGEGGGGGRAAPLTDVPCAPGVDCGPGNGSPAGTM